MSKLKTEMFGFIIADEHFFFHRDPNKKQIWIEREDQKLLNDHFKQDIELLYDFENQRVKLKSNGGDIFGYYKTKRIN